MNETVGPPPAATSTAAAIAARSGSNFLAGFVCLPPDRRAAMTAIYAFCRVVDDAADDAPDAATGRAHLQFWIDELAAAQRAEARTPVGRELQSAMQRFAVPAAPLRDLIEGVTGDLEGPSIADERQLERYCYCVASAVGLASLPALGADGDAAHRFAVQLGQALQTTNILRDLRSDAELGRCYVPTTWLADDGVQREWLTGTGPSAAYLPDGPVHRLCRRLSGRAATAFAAARRELRTLPRPARRALVPARIMAAVYAALLHKLEARGGAVLLPRARLSRPHKLWLVASCWAGIGW